MVNKRTSESNKQKSKKQKSDTEVSDSQNIDNSNKNEIETTPKRSTRTRSKNNSEDNNENNAINNPQNNNSEMTLKKTIPVESSADLTTSYRTNETNSITNSPVITRGRAARKAKKTDSEVSSPALSERSRRSESDTKSTRGRSKSKRSRYKKVSQSEQLVMEDNGTVDNAAVKSQITTEKEIVNETPVAVEIDGKGSSPLKPQLAITMSSETSLQEIDHSSVLSSEHSISSVTEIKDEADESEISVQQVTSQTSSSTTEKVKPSTLNLKNFTIEIKSNIKQSNESDPKTDTIHNNSGTKTTPPASNHYNSRSHSKRRKKLTSKKHELSSRSVYIPAGLVNPFREKSHHQKVDENIKEDMEIIRECIRSKSESPSKLETEKQDKIAEDSDAIKSHNAFYYEEDTKHYKVKAKSYAKAYSRDYVKYMKDEYYKNDQISWCMEKPNDWADAFEKILPGTLDVTKCTKATKRPHELPGDPTDASDNALQEAFAQGNIGNYPSFTKSYFSSQARDEFFVYTDERMPQLAIASLIIQIAGIIFWACGKFAIDAII